MWRYYLKRTPTFALRGIAILGVVVQSVRIIEEAERIVKARRKRQLGFSSGLDFDDD